MAKLTQGTQIYFIDPDDSSVVTVTGVTTFNPGGAPADQIEITPLEAGVKEFMRGLRTPGQASMEVNADPTDDSHIRLHELAQDDTVTSMEFAIGWSDGKDVEPDVTSDGEWDLPGTRTWFTFDGYVSDFPFDFSSNNVVKSTITIQRTGTAIWTEKEATSE